MLQVKFDQNLICERDLAAEFKLDSVHDIGFIYSVESWHSIRKYEYHTKYNSKWRNIICSVLVNDCLTLTSVVSNLAQDSLQETTGSSSQGDYS